MRQSLILFLTAVICGVAFVAQSAGMEHLGPFTYNGVRSVLGGLVLIPCIVLLNRIQGRNGSEERDTDGRLQQNPAVDGTVHSKLSSCSTCRLAGRMAIHAVKVRDFHSKLPSCSTCRLAGRMAIHAVKVRDFHSNNRQLLTGGLCCGIILFAASNFQQFGIQYTTVGKAGFITAMYILIVPVLGLLFHKKAGLQVWIGVLFGVTGLYLLCMQDSLRLDRGDALVLVCAFIFSLHILVIDHFSQKVDGVKMSCIQFWVCGILSLLCSVLFESPDLHSIVISWLPVCYGGIMSCGVAYTLQIVGQKGMNPTVASLILSLESVVSVIAGFLLLGQAMSRRELFGCLMMLMAIIFAQLPDRKKDILAGK